MRTSPSTAIARQANRGEGNRWLGWSAGTDDTGGGAAEADAEEAVARGLVSGSHIPQRAREPAAAARAKVTRSAGIAILLYSLGSWEATVFGHDEEAESAFALRRAELAHPSSVMRSAGRRSPRPRCPPGRCRL
jgi:hypothetical protein